MLAALSEDLILSPSNYIRWLTSVYNSSSKGSQALLWTSQSPSLTFLKPYTYTWQKYKQNLKNKPKAHIQMLNELLLVRYILRYKANKKHFPNIFSLPKYCHFILFIYIEVVSSITSFVVLEEAFYKQHKILKENDFQLNQNTVWTYLNIFLFKEVHLQLSYF